MGEVKFKEFTIKDIFDISTGSLAPSGTLIPGVIPRVTASSVSNGVIGFYGDVSGLTYVEDVVTISFLGDSFYHKGRVSLEMKVHSLSNNRMTGNSGLYVSGVLSKLKKYYSYGSQLSSSKLKTLKIELPTTSEGAPDWDYMDNYIKEIKIRKMKEIIESYSHLDKQKYELEDVEFGEFRAGDFLEPYNIVGINTSSMVSGLDFDYITRTSLNRGIHSKTGEIESIIQQPSGVFSLGLLGMDFFYRESQWYAGQFVRGFKLSKNITPSKNTTLYLECSLNKLSSKLKSVLVRDVDRVFKESLLCFPIGVDKQPNWDYMDKYIHNIKIDKVNMIISELETEIENLSRL